MRLTCNNILLLLASEVDELHSVTRYADSKVSVLRLLRVLHGIAKLVDTKHVYVQVVSTTAEVTIHYANQSVGTLLVVLSQSVRTDGLSV